MNKKIVIIMAIYFCSIAIANAQSNDPREKLAFGLKLGVNASNVWDEQNDEFRADAKAGLVGGAFLGIPIGELLGVQPELLISQKGFKANGTLLGAPYSTRRTTTYLDVPLQLQIKPNEFVTFLIGPQFSYLLQQSDEYTFGDNSTEQKEEFDNENIRDNILGFVVGADIIYNHVVLSLRAGWDFQNNHGDGTSNTPRYKNQWLQFTLGYQF